MGVTIASPSSVGFDPVAGLRQALSAGPDAIFRAASVSLRSQCEDAALPLLRVATTRYDADARLWQMRALMARNLGESAEAVAAFARASDLAPADALILHGTARARLEAGLPSIDDFVRARVLAPRDGSIVLGLAAARFAASDVAGAIAEVDGVVARNPAWIEGHATLARLRRMAGEVDPLRSYREAVARAPATAAIWLDWLATLAAAEQFADLQPAVAAARRALGPVPAFDLYDAIAADETGAHATAAAYFDATPTAAAAGSAVWHVRSLLRRGRWQDATALAENVLHSTRDPGMWPYLALGWRALGDPRWKWLEGDDRFVRTYDIAADVGDLSALAKRLRDLHIARDRPLDQSVRGGTQTDGPLLARTDPEIVRLLNSIRGAVARYVAQLPSPDQAHPLLGAPRGRVRFAGSWSVRLTGGGHHADHVHSHGWISSALYVALPPAIGGSTRAGWLTLGGSGGLVPSLTPFQMIEPKPGRLVLFPSTMWHGTRPFDDGERLTVAFDVARMIA